MKAVGKKLTFRLLLTCLPLLLLSYILVLYGLIRRTAARDDAQQADIIIVFGAAQYNGRPSPVFKARLDHTAGLFKSNYAQKIMTTGGHGLDSRFTEADVGRNYLVKLDIPAECILTEPIASTTLGTINRVLEFLRLEHHDRVIAVSDGFHLFRIKQIFRDNQIVAYGSPARHSPIESNLKLRTWASLREVLVYSAYLAHQKMHLPIPETRY
jgi:uncharacterized SAM-binding protein YcdF (DUF218 family)